MSPIALVAFAGIVVAGVALAQTPAPTAAPAASPAAIASKCTKPDPHPGRLSTERQQKNWTKETQTWQECMKKYVTEMQGKANDAVKAANAAVAEANAAAAEYNNTVNAIQADLDALK